MHAVAPRTRFVRRCVRPLTPGQCSGEPCKLVTANRRASELCGTHTAQPCAAQYCCSRATASWNVRALAPAPAPLLLAGAGTGGLGLGSRAATAGAAVLCAAPAAARQSARALCGGALAAAAHLQHLRPSCFVSVPRGQGPGALVWESLGSAAHSDMLAAALLL